MSTVQKGADYNIPLNRRYNSWNKKNVNPMFSKPPGLG